MRTSAELYETMDMLVGAAERVEQKNMPKSKFESLEKACGLHANRDGLIAHKRLREVVDIVDTMTYDWVHNMLQEGVFSVEATALLRAAEAHGVSRKQVHDFLKDKEWVFPTAMRTKSAGLHRVFNEWRTSASDPNQATTVTLQ